jgi:hypothetical protein
MLAMLAHIVILLFYVSGRGSCARDREEETATGAGVTPSPKRGRAGLISKLRSLDRDRQLFVPEDTQVVVSVAHVFCNEVAS